MKWFCDSLYLSPGLLDTTATALEGLVWKKKANASGNCLVWKASEEDSWEN